MAGFLVGRSKVGSTDYIGGATASTVSIDGSQVTETDTANPGSIVITLPGAQAIETETANPGAPLVTLPGGRVIETETANPGSIVITLHGAQVTETDTANAGTVVGGVYRDITIVSEPAGRQRLVSVVAAWRVVSTEVSRRITSTYVP